MQRLLYLGAVLYGLSFWYAPAHDPDLGWHLLGGQWTIEHGAPPRADFINAFNAAWVDYHWLAQIIFFKVYQLFGLDGLRTALGVLMAWLCKVLLDIIFAAGGRKLPVFNAAVFFLFSILLIGHVASIRPQMLAILGIALAVRTLLTPGRRELLHLFLLAAVLTNMHVYWVFIPLLWFFFRCLPRFTRRRYPRAAYAWGGLALLLLAGFISPYGIFGLGAPLPFGIFSNYALIFDYALTTYDMKEAIAEFKGSLAIDGRLPLLFLVYCTLIGAGAGLRRALAKFPLVVSALFSLWLAFRTLKFMAIFAVAGLPLLVRARRPFLLPSALRYRAHFDRWACAFLLVLGAVFSIGYAPPLFDTSAYMQELPLDACRRLTEIPLRTPSAASPVRVLTHFDYGGWCRWAMYQARPDLDYRVTTDGRTQFVAPAHYVLSFDLYRLHYAWATTLRDWAPDVALVEKNRALAQFMLHAPNFWRLAYEDRKFALFVPVRRATASAPSSPPDLHVPGPPLPPSPAAVHPL